MMCSRTPFIVLFGLALVNNGLSLSDSENGVTDRISVSKCTEYQKLCPLNPPPFNTDGELAAVKEFPHAALIGYERDNKFFWPCSGTLISENFVLTAGHCIKSRQYSVKYVRLGDLDFKTEEEDAEVREFNITQSFPHPNYTNGHSYDDIALLKIDRPVEFSEYIQPACLHLNTVITDRVIATGWGITSSSSERPSSLQKVQLNLVPFDVCKESYPPSQTLQEGLVNRTQLCAGSNTGERDTCAGFGGASVLNTGHKFSCLYETVAITSFGYSCGAGHPGVYTRVTPYVDWIESIVWPDTQ